MPNMATINGHYKKGLTVLVDRHAATALTAPKARIALLSSIGLL